MLIAGKEQDVKVIGSDEQYATVRNLKLLAGRFMDENDVALREHVALLTEKLAKRLFGSQPGAIGETVKIHGLQFTVIGTFKERTESFGLSELSNETMLIPLTVIRYFTNVERIDPLYVQAKTPEDVEPLTTAVRQIIESRHRQGAKYDVENLSSILDAAEKIALVLTVVLLLVSAIALVISGIGIMNIMLVTVTERTREIGLRMAVGASRREIQEQFLTEAVLISISGARRNPHWHPHTAQRPVFHGPVPGAHLGAVHLRGVRSVAAGGRSVRSATGQPRIAPESDRGAALRVTA